MFLDTGTVKDLFAGWQASGKPLAVYLQEGLRRFIDQNPHFSEAVVERKTIKSILRAYGFNLDAKNLGEFYSDVAYDRQMEVRSYLKPSELGFLLSGEPPSDADEFGGGESRWRPPDGNEVRYTTTLPSGWEEFTIGDVLEQDGKRYRILGTAIGTEDVFLLPVDAATKPETALPPPDDQALNALRDKYKDKMGLDEIGNFSEGRAWVSKDGQVWFITGDGTDLSSARYVGTRSFSGGRAVVKRDQQFWFIKEDGTDLSSARYDEVGNFSGGRAWVVKDGQEWFIDLNGDKIADV